MAVLCAPQRVVYCASDTNLKHCEAVASAVAEIASVVPGLMEYRGTVTWGEVASLRARHAPVTIVADIPRELMADVPSDVLAVTFALPDLETMCLGYVPIALLWAEGEIGPEHAYSVITHELMHSLGAEHASGDVHWQTVMDRAPTHHGLAIIDRNWLRAVYGG